MVTPATLVGPSCWTKVYIKKLVWHLQDIIKCMQKIEKEKQKRKEIEKFNKQLDDIVLPGQEEQK